MGRRIAVTGGQGFLGWHLRVLLRSRGDDDVVMLDRETCEEPKTLASAIDGVDRVVHLAGANRGTDAEVREGNLRPARALAKALERVERAPDVAFADSTQNGNGTVYGTAKAEALELLQSATGSAGSGLLDARLPNLFGEHGRPHYNSVIATFSHELATGGAPVVVQDRELELLHARTAAELLADAAPADGPVIPSGQRRTVAQLLASLTYQAQTYARGEIPALPDDFALDLFNTYRSFCPPVLDGLRLPKQVDDRGALVEAVKAHGSTGQCFFSTSHSGVTRGQHYHLRKVERFLVLDGDALISLRRVLHPEVVQHRVRGDDPVAVDMPAMWVHSITNVGQSPLLTLFWSNDLFDPAAPDTYPEAVWPAD